MMTINELTLNYVKQNEDLRAQNAELLAALVRLRLEVTHYRNTLLDEALVQAQAAIAKAEGRE